MFKVTEAFCTVQPLYLKHSQVTNVMFHFDVVKIVCLIYAAVINQSVVLRFGMTVYLHTHSHRERHRELLAPGWGGRAGVSNETTVCMTGDECQRQRTLQCNAMAHCSFHRRRLGDSRNAATRKNNLT